MKDKLKHISSYTELSFKSNHPFILNEGKLIESNANNDLEKDQKEDLEKLNQLLLRLKKLSDSPE
jgi:hypothetical protein